jgi:pimeloyl-ACP methyl ester carboxylesterase
MPVPLPEVPGVTHRQVDVAGLSVHVAEAGSPDAPPLVLLHGWPQHWLCWRRIVPLLAGDFRLLMPDLRGFGWSDAPETGYDKEQLATDLLGLLDALDLSRVGLVGHDWGGWTGFLACLREPERFRGFLALGITHPFQHPDFRVVESWRLGYQVALSTPVLPEWALRTMPALVEGAVRLGARRRDVFPPEVLRSYAEVLREPARARASVRLYRTFQLREALPVFLGRYADARLTVPTRLVGGRYDPVVTPALLAGYEGRADDMTVEVLDGVGHFVPEEAPEVVADHVRALFRQA